MNQALARILPLAVALPVVALAACSSSGGSDEPSDSLPSSPGPVAIGWQAPRPDPQAPRSDPQAPGGSGTGSGTDPGAGGPGLNCSSLCDRVPQRCVPDCQDSCGELAADEFEAIGCGGEARAVFLCVYSAGLTCDDEG
ncbi:MAG: hypothetical protein FJ104_17415, partial [Deltaproteobacteria bacterium]|nr:hypothetical protein [Deltaproteobacteria bacterium]